MNKISTAYDTLPYRGHSIKAIEQGLALIAINGGVGGLNFANAPALCPLLHSTMPIAGDDKYVTMLPQFVHPVPYIDDVTGDVKMAVDLRTLVRQDLRTREYSVTRYEEAEMRLLYGVLSHIWYCQKDRHSLSVNNVYTNLFANWIRDTINRRVAVSPIEQMQIAILAGLYYESMFYNGVDRELNDRELNGIAMTVSRGLNVAAKEVYDLIERSELVLPIANITDFCQSLYKVTQNVRLQDFDPATLITLVAKTTTVDHAAELTAAALEYPPTWIALAYRHLTQRMLKNTTIGRVAERVHANQQALAIRAVIQLAGAGNADHH